MCLCLRLCIFRFLSLLINKLMLNTGKTKNALSSGLALINDYSSDDDYYDDDNDSLIDEDYDLTNENTFSCDNSDGLKTTKQERLPLPNVIANRNGNNEHSDDPAAHNGRIRTFAHERGNWASYVFIPFEATDEFHSFVKTAVDLVETVPLRLQEELHVTLSRTFILFHHWITGFVESVEQKLQHIHSFEIVLNGLEVYINRERTRTFLAINVQIGHNELMSVVNALETCLNEYRLSTYYKKPSFHVSIAWCLGDKKSLLQSYLPTLNEYFQREVLENPESFGFRISNCESKIGNKRFRFKLKE